MVPSADRAKPVMILSWHGDSTMLKPHKRTMVCINNEVKFYFVQAEMSLGSRRTVMLIPQCVQGCAPKLSATTNDISKDK